MKKLSFVLIFTTLGLILSSCAGIKYLSIETREPAQVTLPANIRSVIIVNNTVVQPEDVGHSIKHFGEKEIKKMKVSLDSVAIYYTEALSQFLEEEKHFDRVLYYGEPLRTDNDFFQEQPIDPVSMNEIRNKTGVDAIISLDKLLLQFDISELYKEEGYTFKIIDGKIHSILRVYLPTMDGKIPAVRYTDSLTWEGWNIQDKDSRATSDLILPLQKDIMKELAVHAAEKMTSVFSPHWIMQDRWYYTSSSSLARQAETFSKNSHWIEAINKWKEYYDKQRNDENKAKAAHNIAFANEMLGDMDKAYEWATIAYEHFVKSTTKNALERRRSLLYKNELERRRYNDNTLNMQQD